MGKSRPPERSKLAKKQKRLLAEKRKKNRPTHTPEQLLAQSALLIQQSDFESALQLATSALNQLKENLNTEEDLIKCLPALNLLGEINVELGDIEAARDYFVQAAQIDDDGDVPEEKGGGADKFMWLAQLSEEGGADSVKWFEKGAQVLRADIEGLDDAIDEQAQEQLEEKKSKLATALCAIAEIYMTDLSWDDDKAEGICNKVMEEAIQLAPNNPETLQTLASVRISQSKRDEAKQYLSKSLGLWKDLPEESPDVPDFPVRISLARLLMEAEMEDEAIEVLERLIQEDDHSVEAWYLGGWCLHLLAERQAGAANGHSADSTEHKEMLTRSRRWLLQCMKLYDLLEYEDEKLGEHATELIASLNKILGEPPEDEADASDWEDEDNDDGENGDEMDED